MEAEKTVSESYSMNGGVGCYSYAKNSSLQRTGLEAAKAMLHESIMEKLDIKNLSNPNPFRITDLGCSIGPNTFIAIQNIVEAIENKYYQSEGVASQLPEFQVFFNDQISNDFNTLFASLPLERRYFANGVPGSFCARLFPEKSIHFVHSFAALHWLSKVPEEVKNIHSPAWNKGRIYYLNAPNEVMEAYSRQHAKDMENFLDARAREVVHGGLVALCFVCVADGSPHSHSRFDLWFDLLGSVFMDMVKMGAIDGDKVDSFNLPIYIPSPMEVQALVEKNGHFSLEIFETWTPPAVEGPGSSEVCSTHTRACVEGLIREHFGSDDEIIEEMFHLYTKKLEDYSAILESSEMTALFVLLKRKVDS